MLATPHRIRPAIASILTAVACTIAVFVLPVPAPAAAAPGSTTPTQCPTTTSGADQQRVEPARVALDPVAVRDAIAYAESHMRATVRVYRNNCLVGTGRSNTATSGAQMPVFSATKSVVSILTGIAADHGALRLDDAIGRYLPTGRDWGDAAHRAITVRQLLTQTSGLQSAEIAEVASVGNDPDIAQEALAQPLVARPGTYFSYSQRGPDLLAFVVQRAVGTDLQAFADRYLFAPLGIAHANYTWLRDRTGHTYGYAHLFLQPGSFAKLGLLMLNEGTWAGRQIVSPSYAGRVSIPSAANGCYGLLFWTNRGTRCTAGEMPYRQTIDHRMILSAPPDLYAIDGAAHQDDFMIPSLRIAVMWMGVAGDANSYGTNNPAASDLFHNFFRILLHGVRDTPWHDPGPYQAPPTGVPASPDAYADPNVLLRDLAPSAH
ncbi:serine hydrolase domain-containing protein [Gordonia sp. DT30]|uniref:serine hydrolase domain-containing protein n=1 Tax=unclassified Gordonia (in: high G+C Gram-positive bacteria) TaxID=2657482 RepID=UPI003CFA1E5E